MKLASALSRRAELKTKLRQLEQRLNQNALVQEGEEPAEDPKELLRELHEGYLELETFIANINRTNSKTKVSQVNGGEAVLSDLLARRDCLTSKLNAMRHFLDCASSTVHRRMASEIKIKSTVSVRELQKQVDQYAKELRELDDKIQEANWSTELLEESGRLEILS